MLFSNFGPFGARRPFGGNTPSGTINFDYGMKTIKFGEAVDEAEGKHLLNFLKGKKLLLDKNFE